MGHQKMPEIDPLDATSWVVIEKLPIPRLRRISRK